MSRCAHDDDDDKRVGRSETRYSAHCAADCFPGNRMPFQECHILKDDQRSAETNSNSHTTVGHHSSSIYRITLIKYYCIFRNISYSYYSIIL